MVKTIKIGSNSYDMKSSAFTMFAYKNETGRNLLDDINSINDMYVNISKLPEEEQNSTWMKNITEIIEKVLRLAYIMIKEQDKSFKPYEEWLKDLDNLFDDSLWVQEVLEVGISPFSGRI